MNKVLDRLSLLQKLLLLLLAFVASVLAIAFGATTTIDKVRIGGEMQQAITADSDLLADILPPPLFLIEAQHLVSEMRVNHEASRLERQVKELRALQESFAQRISHWQQNPHEDDEQQLLMGPLRQEAERFYSQALGGYLEALRSDDPARIAQEFSALEAIAETQKATVLQLVEMVSQGSATYRKQAAEETDRSITTTYWIIAASFTLFVLIFLLVLRSIRSQVGGDPAEAREALHRVLAGDTQLNLKVASGDQHSLMAAIARVIDLTVQNTRVRSALDNCSTNVMIADTERTIIYMNKTVEAMLQNAEADLRKVLPSFAVSQLRGSSIDQFHKNPEHQQRLLATFTSTYRTQIEVGGRTFSLVANPVMSDGGQRLGSVVEWNDRTLEVQIEREVAGLVTAATAGDFSQRIDESNKSGFYLNLAKGLNQLMNTADQGLRDVVRVLGALAEGDLTQRISADYQGTFAQLKDFSNDTAGSLSRMLGQIREAADTIYTAAGEISAGNTDLSSRTEEQASSLEETASSMEELTSTVKLNADNARQANSLAVNASEVAVNGGSVVELVVRTMSSINESSRKIADIISVIDGIAFQTNILALNAAVEAARAGEQGRGFAVVAGEVRTLAQRSAAAAKEIKTLISDSVEKVENGNELVAQAGKTMSEIVIAIKRVTDIMAEIAAASGEQSTGIEEINGAVSQMDEMTQQNAALVEQAAASAESLLEQAAVLSQSVAVFKFEHSASQPQAKPAPMRALSSVPNTRLERSLPKPAAKVSKNKDDEWEEF